ncbi:hypothetical protein [Shewanella woodyi]|uniref:Uncharacterized protein n=1 Tax=Shewanella woodyi (strain ATCC 51908 / MS32) TaxID=392500 RepID=B1KPB8_SHEWM|nr:hypothetical protein [Shewanella woodyi]ACA84688.1 hypothetical protein Swoo_0389 [Shewanella woodyi ATCC 51908]
MNIELYGYSLEVDVKKTKRTYESIQSSGCEECGCLYCQNFQKSIPECFPKELLDFFEKSCIDLIKDAEVYHYTDVSDDILNYGGEFYLWGKVLKHPSGEPELANNFTFSFTEPSPLAQEAFKGSGAICFSFSGDIKWLM